MSDCEKQTEDPRLESQTDDPFQGVAVIDSEVLAIAQLMESLRPLPYETRCRIMRYVGSWIADPKNGGPEDGRISR